MRLLKLYGVKMTDTLINALIKAQQEIDHVIQDSKNPFFSSDYASLKGVIDSVKKPLNDNGIYLQQVSHDCDRGACIETIFYGYGGKLSTGKVTIPANKQDPQAYGSALSYAKRYSLLMACGVASQKEDDDGERAMERGKPKLITTNFEFKNLGGKVIRTFKSPENYLILLRKEICDVNDTSHRACYEVNKHSIKKARDSADKVTKEAYDKLIDLYESYED